MQIKTFTASSMKDVLSQIKKDLGPEAVIISTKEVQDNDFGIMTKPLIEVIAAVDYDDNIYQSHFKENPPAMIVPPVKARAQEGPVNVEHLSEDLIELKCMMKDLIAHTGATLHKDNPTRNTLIGTGIRANLTDMILSKLGKDADVKETGDLLKKILRTKTATGEKTWAFLGTTGVGKTTTIAKIAAMAVLNEHKKVGLITLDTYRIGAVDQGRIYAKILNIPFISATTESEFKNAMSQLDGMDLILIDTVGRSAFREDTISDLKRYFEGIPILKFLLIPVATRDREMDKITKCFSRLDIDRMIFTKADEALQLGSIITHNLLFRTPISYITTGQRVPEDIEPATPAKIINRCLGEIS